MTQPATDTDEKRIEGTSGLTMTIDPVSDSSSGRDSRRSEPPTQATPGSAGSEMDRLGADEESAPFKATKRFLLVFVALSVLTLMVALDGTSISVALPIIADRLNGTGIEAFWAGTSFLLSSTVFQPMFAQTSHIFGRMPMIMLCLAIFLAGVILAGVSKNFTILLAGRTVQGIGGGGIITLTEVVITDLVPLRWRGKWSGIIAGTWSLGSVSGPIIGGALASSQWRWIFWINLPFIGVALVLVPLFLRLQKLPESLRAKLKRVDWIGCGVFLGSATSLLIPLTWGGISYPWGSWQTLVPLFVGLAGLVGFAVLEIYVAVEPMIPPSIFKNRTIIISFGTTILHGIILWCLLYYQPLYYEGAKGYSPLVTGVALLPSTFTTAPMALITGLLIARTGTYIWSLYLGWSMATLGLGLMILLERTSSVPQWVFINLTSGMGLGVLFPALQFQVQSASPSRDMAFAVAMFVFFRHLGQVLGIAIGGVVFQNQMLRELRKSPLFADTAHDLVKDAAALIEIIKATPDGLYKRTLQDAYVDSLRSVYVLLCALAGAALLSSFFTKTYSLDVALETEQGLTEKKEKTSPPAAREGTFEETA